MLIRGISSRFPGGIGGGGWSGVGGRSCNKREYESERRSINNVPRYHNSLEALGAADGRAWVVVPAINMSMNARGGQ